MDGLTISGANRFIESASLDNKIKAEPAASSKKLKNYQQEKQTTSPE